MRRPFLLLCLCILVSVALAGCGGDENIKDAPYANVPLEDVEGNDLTGASAEHLYQAGHEQLVAENPEKALRVYLEIQSRFPFSPQATQAALETATAHYLLEDYARTVSAVDRFIKQHPRHPNIDYLYYLRGLANYHRNDAGLLGGDTDQRDLSYLRQAFSDFQLLIRNFPTSVYAKDAQMHMVEIRNRLADFELSVAEYYLGRHAYVAAARRASYIIQHYQRSAATPRALEIMQESYIQLGLSDLARDARSILQASYPDYILHRDEFYRELANNDQGDDALPGADATTTAENAGLLESLWNEVTPDSDEDDAGDAWLQGNPGKNLHPDRQNPKPSDNERAGTESPVKTPGAPAEAPEGAATASSPSRENAPANNLQSDQVSDGDVTPPPVPEADDEGFFESVWNVLTPGDGDKSGTRSETAPAADTGDSASDPWLEGKPAKK